MSTYTDRNYEWAYWLATGCALRGDQIQPVEFAEHYAHLREVGPFIGVVAAYDQWLAQQQPSAPSTFRVDQRDEELARQVLEYTTALVEHQRRTVRDEEAGVAS